MKTRLELMRLSQPNFQDVYPGSQTRYSTLCYAITAFSFSEGFHVAILIRKIKHNILTSLYGRYKRHTRQI